MSNPQPDNVTLRPATLDDLPAIYTLLQASERALYGYSDTILAYIRAAYSSSKLDLEKDTRLAFNQAGQLVGSMMLEQSQYANFEVAIPVFPFDLKAQLGDYFLRLAESRARELRTMARSDVKATLSSWVASIDLAGLQCYERAGFQEVQRNWRMEIAFHAPPILPIWPEGIELRPFDPVIDDHAVFEQIERAFQEDWVYTPEDFADWRAWTIEQPDFDPSLCFIAWAGNQVVGSVMCHAGPPSWINTLAVARQWRSKGLGFALLQHAFHEFYRRGWRRAALAVHAQNPTGAVKLYQRAGMRNTREYLNMKKEL